MTTSLLPAAVASVLGAPGIRPKDVEREPLVYDAFHGGRRLTRVRGSAIVDGVERSWSLVEKVTAPPGVASPYLRALAERELAAYRSGLLTAEVPGFVAARAHGTHVDSDGTVVLLLEEVVSRPWALDTHLLVARHLGRLAARWLERAPRHPWLFLGWAEHHSQLPSLDEGSRLVEHLLHAPPRELADVTFDQMRPLLEHQPRYHAALQKLPQTLCHHDAVRSNLFVRNRAGGMETVAIDWELVGVGAVGADLASLLFASVRRGNLSVDWLHRLVTPAVDAYVAGMADMGVELPASTVRAGLVNATCLRWTLLRDVLVAASLGDGAFRRGAAPHESPSEARRQLMALTRWLVAVTAEAAD